MKPINSVRTRERESECEEERGTEKVEIRKEKRREENERGGKRGERGREEEEGGERLAEEGQRVYRKRL